MNNLNAGGPSRMAVLVSVFLVRGPLGLGLLWKSERFSRTEKKVLTFVVVAYTLVLAVAFYWAGSVIFARMAS